MVCQDINLQIFMFGWKELKLYKEHIVGGAGTCLKISNSIFKCLNLFSFLLRWNYYKISPGLKVRRLSKVDELQKSDNLSGISQKWVLCCTRWIWADKTSTALHGTLFSIFLLFCGSHYKMWLQGKLTAATYQENIINSREKLPNFV